MLGKALILQEGTDYALVVVYLPPELHYFYLNYLRQNCHQSTDRTKFRQEPRTCFCSAIFVFCASLGEEVSEERDCSEDYSWA
jgi:hypothetical protein